VTINGWGSGGHEVFHQHGVVGKTPCQVCISGDHIGVKETEKGDFRAITPFFVILTYYDFVKG